MARSRTTTYIGGPHGPTREVEVFVNDGSYAALPARAEGDITDMASAVVVRVDGKIVFSLVLASEVGREGKPNELLANLWGDNVTRYTADSPGVHRL